jgi:hypothetical protein
VSAPVARPAITVFTLCSNNYLAQATVLGRSVKRHNPAATFLIVLVDLKIDEIDYAAIPFEVLTAESIEPRTVELALKYDIIELNTCIKPRVIEYLFSERNAERVIYLDPDTKVFAPLSAVEEALDNFNVVLTPHALTPIPLDGKTPTEIAFLRFGVFNLGFIALKKSAETVRLAGWWKERTYAAGQIRPEDGIFVDQLYVNLVPILFADVFTLRHPGYNMAPWNLHERTLDVDGDGYRVNVSQRLVFFHFSSFRINSSDLPVHAYNRFSMKDRPDLVALYRDYTEELKGAGHARYSGIGWAYRKAALRQRGALEKRARTLCGKGVVWGIRRLPASVREQAYRLFRDLRD